MFNTPPLIERITTTDEGYTAQAFTLVDGYPAQVKIKVDTERRQRYSDYDINVFDPVAQVWGRVYTLTHDEVGRMPLPGVGDNDADVLEAVNRVAYRLWSVADFVAVTARERETVIDAVHEGALEAARQEARLAARDEDLEVAAQMASDLVRSGLSTIAELDQADYEGYQDWKRRREAADAAEATQADYELHGSDDAPYTGTDPEDQG